MKTAIAIDSLLLRDDSIFILELVLALYPESEIYTICHKQGNILGRIETRPIVSSFLTHKIKSFKDLSKKFLLIPGAVGGIPLHPSIKKLIVISRGYIHGLKIPDSVERYLYILDWDLLDENQLGWQKIFRPYVNKWREAALTKFPKISVSSNFLKNRLELPNAEVISPTYRTEEFPFVKDEDHNFDFTHQLLFTHGLSVKEFRTVAKFLLDQNETVRILGPDAHLDSVKKEFPQLEFGGDHCEATTAMYSHQAKAVWDFSKGYFPGRSFGAMATGRPVVTRKNAVNQEFLKEGALFLPDFSLSALEMIYQDIDKAYQIADRRALRRLGLKWNERLFKSKIGSFLS